MEKSLMNVVEWLKKLFKRLRYREDRGVIIKQGKVAEVSGPVRIEDAPRTPVPRRGGIRSTDLGMRKVARHGRRARQFERRSGIDHSKRMVDIEDDQTRKRKKRTWFEDRKK